MPTWSLQISACKYPTFPKLNDSFSLTWSPKATWTNTTRITKSTALKRGASRKRHKLGWVMVALSLLCWSIYLCFRYFDRFRTLSCNFHPASSNFPPSIPLIFLNFPPSINPLLHALITELFFPPRVCSSATHLFVHICVHQNSIVLFNKEY